MLAICILMDFVGPLVEQELFTLTRTPEFPQCFRRILFCCSIFSFMYSVLSVLLRFTVHEYPFDLFKHFQKKMDLQLPMQSVPITTELECRSGRGVQHYVIKFVSDL